MAKYSVKHHQIIESALKKFNADFFIDNKIVFGGGTRIALELDEYRESVDIDFFCPNKDSYRAVRTQVNNVSLGDLVTEDFVYPREIRTDRDAVRTFINHEGATIKLEFVSFDDYDLKSVVDNKLFPLPFLDRGSCYYTKLLANADRWRAAPYKDIFDLLAMYKCWGDIPDWAFEKASEHYGDRVVREALASALSDICNSPEKYIEQAKGLTISPKLANELIHQVAPRMLVAYPNPN